MNLCSSAPMLGEKKKKKKESVEVSVLKGQDSFNNVVGFRPNRLFGASC